MQKSVTIKSIASALGLSLGTISKALNDYPDISEDTKKLVCDKALEMGYTPNLLARNLVKNTSNSVGVIVRDISTVYGELFKPLSRAAKKQNLNLIVADSNRTIEEENKCIQTMIESHVMGIIIAPVNGDYQRINEIVGGRIPVVFMGNSIARPELCYVAPDSKCGTTLALDYLYNLGHRNIALIGDSKQSNSTTAKVSAYRDFMTKHNIIPAVFMDFSEEKTLFDSGYKQACKMLSVDRSFTAVYAVKDEVAIGVVKAIKEAGKEIPKDLSVIGYDGSKVSANPLIELTTVSWDTQVFAEKLISIVISQSNKPSGSAPEHYTVTPYVVERKSCGIVRT